VRVSQEAEGVGTGTGMASIASRFPTCVDAAAGPSDAGLDPIGDSAEDRRVRPAHIEGLSGGVGRIPELALRPGPETAAGGLSGDPTREAPSRRLVRDRCGCVTYRGGVWTGSTSGWGSRPVTPRGGLGESGGGAGRGGR
jgi:hypothetical protein